MDLGDEWGSGIAGGTTSGPEPYEDPKSSEQHDGDTSVVSGNAPFVMRSKHAAGDRDRKDASGEGSGGSEEDVITHWGKVGLAGGRHLGRLGTTAV